MTTEEALELVEAFNGKEISVARQNVLKRHGYFANGQLTNKGRGIARRLAKELYESLTLTQKEILSKLRTAKLHRWQLRCSHPEINQMLKGLLVKKDMNDYKITALGRHTINQGTKV